MARFCSECGNALTKGECRGCQGQVTPGNPTPAGLRRYTPPAHPDWAHAIRPGVTTRFRATGVVIRRELVRMDFAAGVIPIRQVLFVTALIIITARWSSFHASVVFTMLIRVLLGLPILLGVAWILKRSATDGLIASLLGAGLRTRGPSGKRKGWRLEIDTGGSIEKVDLASDPPIVDYQRLTIHGPVIHGVRQAWLVQSVEPSLTEFGRGIIGNLVILLILLPIAMIFLIH